MNCPGCNLSLRSQATAGVEIDSCSGCGGIWFDSGELGPVALALAARPGLDEPVYDLHRTATDMARVTEPARHCPRCRVAMAKLNYAGDSNVIIDRCPDCRGVWCDGPELPDLLRYLKGRDDLRQMGQGILQHTAEMRSLAELEQLGQRLRQPGMRFAWRCLPWIVPLADDTPLRRFPWAVVLVILANVVVLALPAMGMVEHRAFLLELGLIPHRLLSGEGLHALVTSTFAHVGFLHLAGNMLFLWIFGDDVEDRFGSARFLLFYVAVGVLADLPHVALFPASYSPVIGASGAVAGVMGAYFVLSPRSSILLFAYGHLIHLPAWFVLGAWFALQTTYAIIALATGFHGGVAWWSHVSGFAFGAALALAWERRQAPASGSGRAH